MKGKKMFEDAWCGGGVGGVGGGDGGDGGGGRGWGTSIV